MAAVTQLSTAPATRHVIGDLVMRVFTVSGASGSTLATGQKQILFAEPQPFTLAGTASLITGMSYDKATGIITFTTGGGAMVNEVVQVISRVG